jgi:hypothetical protein
LYVHTRSPTGVCNFMHAAYAGRALYPGAGPDAGEAAVECSVWTNFTAWISPPWSRSTRLCMILASPVRFMLCRCLLSTIVFWTGRRRSVFHHWSCAGSRVGVELRAFLPHVRPKQVGSTAYAQLHLTITVTLHVMKSLTNFASDNYVRIDDEDHPCRADSHALGLARATRNLLAGCTTSTTLMTDNPKGDRFNLLVIVLALAIFNNCRRRA